MHGRFRHLLAASIAALAMSAALPASALDANELALVVNRNMPDGLKLAQMYAAARHVPDHRIIELDLPSSEQMSFEVYERDVVPEIREFLRLNDPQRQVKCLVTFYGVPFRIGAHVDSPEELQELQTLHGQLKTVSATIRSLADQTETLAFSLNASFKPADSAAPIIPSEPSGDELNGVALDALARRIDAAGKAIIGDIQQMSDPALHQNAQTQFLALVQHFNGPITFSQPTTVPTSMPAGRPGRLSKSSVPVARAAQDSSTPDSVVAAMPLEDRRFDPSARQEFRDKGAATAGLFGYAKLLLAQIAYLSPQDTEAGTDSELSLLWWTFYPRPRWQMNSLNHHFSAIASTPSLMVSRLDAPTPAIVRQMILSSIHAEQEGLHGRVVIDARGLPLDGPGGKPDAYALYDDRLRRLAALVHLRTTMPVTFDDNPDVLPAHSVQDVALYCGWYSVGKYVPACSFVPGAVGYHTASFEMTSLRDPGNTGWVRGLLIDGIAATLGPVSEPYLQSFPPPDEFFPLLLTGKLTLAEVYWKTELMASWRQCLVGDPLYTPFKNDPQLKIADLPDPLQAVFAAMGTAPKRLR